MIGKGRGFFNFFGKKGVVLLKQSLCSLVVVSTMFFEQAHAQGVAPSETVPSFGERLYQMLPMLLVVYFVFYFLVIRPRAAEEKAQKKLLDELKKGDSVVTSFGLFGKIVKVEQKTVHLEVAPNVQIKLQAKTIVKRETGN
jgi:preprotein translocase subunit YajC